VWRRAQLVTQRCARRSVESVRRRLSGTRNKSAMAQHLAPSPVLHVRNIAPDTVNDDLIAFVSSFGKVKYGALFERRPHAPRPLCRPSCSAQMAHKHLCVVSSDTPNVAVGSGRAAHVSTPPFPLSPSLALTLGRRRCRAPPSQCVC